ncbi:MAG TPA: T9SS type B sorting domain-containing protein [Bacteroidetes bacterium]|nr:T9SS type B sorting domain-containing protein [Bacteroidota bacterium]
MTNRLLLPSRQLRLFLIAFLFPWTINLFAQCDCVSVDSILCQGTANGGAINFSIRYFGNGFLQVSNNCMGDLDQIDSVAIVAPTGNPPTVEISGGYNAMSMVPVGEEVTFSYFYPGGDSDTLCIKIQVVDTLPPALNTIIPNDTVDCEMANFTLWWQAQVDSLQLHATDDCQVDTVYHAQIDTLMDNCGTFVDTFFVVDTFGNATFTVATYTITDSKAPVFTSFPANINLECDQAIPPVATVSADDNCAVSVTPIYLGADTVAVGAMACTNYKYEIRRKWRVTDGCGNTTDSVQIISIDDTTPPVFDMPADITISCTMSTDVSVTGDITNVADNCSPSSELTITMSQITVGGTCPQESVITRTWQVTDACGNSLSKSQTITVEDTQAPTAVFPADITVACFDDTDDSATGIPTMVADNCQSNPTVSKVDVITAGPCEHTFTVERVWSASDACGNTSSQVQIITVKDTIPPQVITNAFDQSFTCDVDYATAFNNWINTHGGAAATDNCVIPGDSLEWDAYIAGTSTIATLPPPDCANPAQGIFTRVTVDFVVKDKCDNRDTTTATFTVVDNDPPVIVNCPNDITVQTDPGQCEALQTLLLPVVMENCGNTTLPVNLSIPLTPTIPAGADPVETPIDDLVFHFNVNGPPYSTAGDATLTIEVELLDAEAPTEYLLVYGENGDLLGTVANTTAQCGDTLTSFTIAANLMDAWAFDGVLTITVRPNIPASLPGRFAVNPICPGNLVTAILSYNANLPVGLAFEYSVNNGTRNPVMPLAPFDKAFAEGVNTVDYYFKDCAGNEANCRFNVTVEDKEAPQIACPPDETINLDAGLCDKEVIVPLFTNVTDNCGVTIPSTQTQAGDSLITFSYNPNLGDYVADDKTFTFTGLQGNATPGGVQLIIELQADVDSTGEYFRIFANGMDLGTTARNQPHVTPGDCNTPATAVFTIPATTFNEWAVQGDIVVEAVSFMSFPIPPAGPTWGINPCDPSQISANGDTDGSYIKATFSYESVTPAFWATGATTIDTVMLPPPLDADTFLLAQGTTTFSYAVTDLAGNKGECQFTIDVLDVEPPVALCGPAFVDINPSGFDVDTVFAAEIDLGSTDNCTIASMVVTPSVFDCGDQGNNPVTLTVTDASGNVSVCSTFVNVTTQQPAPTAISNCGTTQLQLMANPPASSAGNNVIYNYTWYNPAGLPFAYEQNPVIQDAGMDDIGFYTVTIEGVTACQSTASVQVTCDMLPLQQPVLQVADNNICASEMIELSTQAVCGTGVQYKWYTGSFPGVLMATTPQPFYSMLPPSSGAYIFYVIVERNGCDSEFSGEITVQVNAAPVAMAAQTNVLVCEGEQVVLNSINVPPGATCHWTGPSGYESFNCNPAPINNVGLTSSGIYELVVSNNGCPSVPDSVFVNVIALPQMPAVSNTTSANNPACHGEPITLTATVVTGAVSYQWTTPMFTTIVTPGNVLTIPNSDINKDAGNWTVKIIGNSCESQVSAPTTVYIEPLPEAVSSAITPATACEGQDVQLTASTATPNATFQWLYPNNDMSAQPNPLLSNVSTDNSGTYQLTVTTQFGCSVTESVGLEVLDRVDITGVSSNAPDCVTGPVNVQLLATLFPIDNGTYQYLWTGPGGYSSTDPSAIIPNAVAADSGPYTLVVTNSDGCASLATTVNVDIPEVLPTPVIQTPPSYCEGETAILSVDPLNGANVTYVWTTPNTTMTTSEPTLVLADLKMSDAGSYQVNYEVNGCFSATSGAVALEVNPIPVIVAASNSPVCEGEVIELDVNCSAGSVYEWFGPGAFSASVCNPVIPDADPAMHTGIYSIRKQTDGCWSEVETIEIVVKQKPQMPTAFNSGPYCADAEDVMLSVTNGSATAGATYTWYNETGDPIGNNTPALNYAVPNATALGDGDFQFYVVASLDGCDSDPSFPTVVTINTVPANVADAGPPIDACEGQPVFLAATPPSVGTGLWVSAATNPPGVALFNPDEADTQVDGLLVGETYTFEWKLSNGACTDYSTDQTTVFVNSIEEADAGEPITLCHDSEATLMANQPTSNQGHWSQPPAQQMLGITINTPNEPQTIVSGLVPGNTYVFTWTIDGGCGSSSDAVLVTVTNENAFAGSDYQDCGDGSTVLNAVGALSGNGMWSSPDPGISFVTPTDPNTTATNLQRGVNIFVWTIDDGACGAFSTDSVLVDYEFLPVGVDDHAVVPFAGTATLNVVDNDDISGLYTLGVVQEPLHGTVELDPDGRMTYRAEVNFIGEDAVIYEICSEGCECVQATVVFSVGEGAGCMVPSIMTPNHDGMNDTFVIPCLGKRDAYPSNSVSIYNQWGDEVYHAAPYGNDWRGTFDGEDLPPGTYFYVIDLGNGEKPMSGYLIIQR